MADKSGVEMLEEILQKMDLLSKKVDILDQNIKKIANSAKVSELINKAHESNISGWTKPKQVEVEKQPTGMRFTLESVDASRVKQMPSPNKNAKATINNMTMVNGKMITLSENQSVPLPGISIRIFDGKNTILKETKTNKAGQWMAQLMPGKYVVEMTGSYKGQDLVPQNKVFEVPVGVTEFEVK